MSYIIWKRRHFNINKPKIYFETQQFSVIYCNVSAFSSNEWDHNNNQNYNNNRWTRRNWYLSSDHRKKKSTEMMLLTHRE